jgi:hypothetical protein
MLDLAKQIGTCLIVAGALYGGIRADLTYAVKEAERANARFDAYLMERANHG